MTPRDLQERLCQSSYLTRSAKSNTPVSCLLAFEVGRGVDLLWSNMTPDNAGSLDETLRDAFSKLGCDSSSDDDGFMDHSFCNPVLTTVTIDNPVLSTQC